MYSIVAEADAYVVENSGSNFGNSGALLVLDANGQLIGFEADLATELARRLGVEA